MRLILTVPARTAVRAVKSGPPCFHFPSCHVRSVQSNTFEFTLRTRTSLSRPLSFLHSHRLAETQPAGVRSLAPFLLLISYLKYYRNLERKAMIEFCGVDPDRKNWQNRYTYCCEQGNLRYQNYWACLGRTRRFDRRFDWEELYAIIDSFSRLNARKSKVEMKKIKKIVNH